MPALPFLLCPFTEGARRALRLGLITSCLYPRAILFHLRCTRAEAPMLLGPARCILIVILIFELSSAKRSEFGLRDLVRQEEEINIVRSVISGVEFER
jgi:hypothetical protein